MSDIAIETGAQPGGGHLGQKHCMSILTFAEIFKE